MLTLLSPAKTLDLDSPVPTRTATQPRLGAEAEALAAIARRLSPEELAELMGISAELAARTADRFADLASPNPPTRPALFTFAGDVYRGLDAHRFDARDRTEAQKTLRILSGLYGLLRPLDLIAPYRLEMGTRLVTDRGVGLYRWWGEQLTDLVAADLAASPGPALVVDLASAEYSRAVDLDALRARGARVVQPRFEDEDARGGWRVVGFSAKYARGLMAGWIVRRRVRSARALRDFADGGYRYQPGASTPRTPVYRRRRPAG